MAKIAKTKSQKRFRVKEPEVDIPWVEMFHRTSHSVVRRGETVEVAAGVVDFSLSVVVSTHSSPIHQSMVTSNAASITAEYSSVANANQTRSVPFVGKIVSVKPWP